MFDERSLLLVVEMRVGPHVTQLVGDRVAYEFMAAHVSGTDVDLRALSSWPAVQAVGTEARVTVVVEDDRDRADDEARLVECMEDFAEGRRPVGRAALNDHGGGQEGRGGGGGREERQESAHQDARCSLHTTTLSPRVRAAVESR